MLEPKTDSQFLEQLSSRFGMDAQQLRYRSRWPPAKPAFGRDREVVHIFFRRGEAPARARDPVGVVHQAERELRSRLELHRRNGSK